MSSLAEEQFRRALGVRQDLRFRIFPPGETSFEVSSGSPCAVIGRGVDAQIRIPRETVAFRHAYVQALGNRVFIVDLFGTNPLRWEDGFSSGWASPRRGFWIGDSRVQLAEDGWEEVGDSLGSPLDHKAREDRGDLYGVLPDVELHVLNAAQEGIRWPINRVITLVGRDERCRVTCNDRNVSRVHCSLVLTASGLWAVDLLGKGGTLVDDAAAPITPLAQGSVLQIGRFQMQVNYLSAPAAVPPARADHVAFVTRLHRIFAVTWDGDTLIVTPQGRSRDFRYQDIQLEANCIIQILRTQAFRNVLVDFSVVRLSGSLIIDALTQFCRAAQGVAAICECSPEQLSSLQDMNLLSLWPHYATRAEAIRALRLTGATQPANG